MKNLSKTVQLTASLLNFRCAASHSILFQVVSFYCIKQFFTTVFQCDSYYHIIIIIKNILKTVYLTATLPNFRCAAGCSGCWEGCVRLCLTWPGSTWARSAPWSSAASTCWSLASPPVCGTPSCPWSSLYL